MLVKPYLIFDDKILPESHGELLFIIAKDCHLLSLHYYLLNPSVLFRATGMLEDTGYCRTHAWFALNSASLLVWNSYCLVCLYH